MGAPTYHKSKAPVWILLSLQNRCIAAAPELAYLEGREMVEVYKNIGVERGVAAPDIILADGTVSDPEDAWDRSLKIAFEDGADMPVMWKIRYPDNDLDIHWFLFPVRVEGNIVAMLCEMPVASEAAKGQQAYMAMRERVKDLCKAHFPREATGLAPSAAHKRIHPVVAYLSSLGSTESRRTTKSALDTVAQILGARDSMSYDWTSLRAVHLEAIRQKLLESQSVKTVSKKISMVKMVLKRCFMEEFISEADWAKIQAVDGPRGKVLAKSKTGRMISPEEFAIMQEYMETQCHTPAGSRDDALFSAAITGGCRRDELSKLTVGDFDPIGGSLDVQGKGNADRRQWIPQYSVDRILAWLRWRGDVEPSAPLFCEVRAVGGGAWRFGTKSLSGNSLLKIMQKRFAAAGIAPAGLHDMRRSYISILIDAGVSLSDVRDLAGHTSAATTELYDRRGDRSRREAARSLNELFQLDRQRQFGPNNPTKG